MSFNLTVPQEKRNQFRLWVGGCCHPKSDNDDNGRKSITASLDDIWGKEGLNCDAGMILGDLSTSQIPADVNNVTHQAEGAEIVSQFNNATVGRSKIIVSPGNHDFGNGDRYWFDIYGDMFGENTVTSGFDISQFPMTVELDGSNRNHLALIQGNVRFLMLCDVNDVDPPIGRNGTNDGGYPSGTITLDTWNWVKTQIANNPNDTIICCHHNMLKDTTIATGDNEGVNGGYHGASGQSIASGYLKNIYNTSNNTYVDSYEIIDYMNNNNGKIYMWIGSHTHYTVGETYATRGNYIYKYGTHHLSVGSLSKTHVAGKDAMSRLLVFNKGSNKLNVLRYIHDSGTVASGFYPTEEMTLTLPRNFIN